MLQQVGGGVQLQRNRRHAQYRQRRLQQRLRIDAMPGAGTEANGVIQAFSGDIDTVVVGRQAQIDKRVQGLELGQARQQPANGKGAHRTHGQHLAVVAAVEAVEGLGDAVEAFAQHRQQGLAFAGEHQPAWQALEQGDLELGFEAFDLMADRRLGHAQLDGRAGKTKVPGRSLERPQGVQGQVRSDHADSQIFLMAAAKYHRLCNLRKAPRLALPAAARLTTVHLWKGCRSCTKKPTSSQGFWPP
ncbi:hypothetical protein D3C79_699520 [compost metagenome]